MLRTYLNMMDVRYTDSMTVAFITILSIAMEMQRLCQVILPKHTLQQQLLRKSNSPSL